MKLKTPYVFSDFELSQSLTFFFNKKLFVYHSNPTTVAVALKNDPPVDLGSDLFRLLGPKAGHQREKNGTAFGSLEGKLRYWWKFRESRGFGECFLLRVLVAKIWMKGKDDQEESLIRYFWVLLRLLDMI